MSSLVFQNTGARIMIASVDQSVRGFKHHQYRPDLLILDDVEDMSSSRTMEGRDKLFEWFTREIVPLGDESTRTIMVGNLLHEDSLIMKLKRKIDKKELKGIFCWFPLLDESGTCLWPGKFDTWRKINDLRQSVANELAWMQEYLLKIVPSDYQIIKEDWIQYYDELPGDLQYRASAVAVDLGVKQGERHDSTAIVCGNAYGYGLKGKIYISPNFFKGKISFLDIVKKAKEFSENFDRARIIVEDVAAQNYVIQQIRFESFFVEEFHPRGDKSERLLLVSPLIQNGQVLFHRSCKPIVDQILNFGIERHDDLCDAFVMLVMSLINIIGHGSSGGSITCPDFEDGGSGEPNHPLRENMIF